MSERYYADRKRKRYDDFEYSEKSYHRREDSRDRRRGYKYRRGVSPSRSTVASSSIDDEVGHFNVSKGFLIRDRYEVISELGKGTFGKVYKCKDHKRKDVIAVKAVRRVPKYVESAQIEAEILDEVYDRQNEQNVDLCVKMYSHFKMDGYYFLVFQTLGTSLYDIIKKNNYKRFPMDFVRDVSRQLLSALEFLESIKLVHTDLKLENVLMVGDALEERRVDHKGKRVTVFVPTNRRIKLIDFGGATFERKNKPNHGIINTRQYRGPEVTLELGWSYPSDIWSAACIIGEIYSGELLFETHDELEHLALMEKCVGKFPPSLFKESKHRRRFFRSDGTVRFNDLDADSKLHVEKMPYLEDVFSLSSDDRYSGIVELMRKMLELDPMRRITASQALRLDFVAAGGHTSCSEK